MSRPTGSTVLLRDQELLGTDLAVVEWVAEPSPDPVAPLHRHLEDDEAWYVLSGRMGFSLDGEVTELPAGGAAIARAGVAHTYWNAGDEPARYLLITTPRIRELIAVLHDPDRRAGRSSAEVFRAYASALVTDAARLSPFSAADFAAAAQGLAGDPLGACVFGFFTAHPERWAALQSDLRRTFAVEVDGIGRVGFIEIEVLGPGTTATFSVFIDAAARGRGCGVAAIDSLIAWAHDHTGVVELVTDTEDWNTASIRALTRCGFSADGDAGDRRTFRRRL